MRTASKLRHQGNFKERGNDRSNSRRRMALSSPAASGPWVFSCGAVLWQHKGTQVLLHSEACTLADGGDDRSQICSREEKIMSLWWHTEDICCFCLLSHSYVHTNSCISHELTSLIRQIVYERHVLVSAASSSDHTALTTYLLLTVSRTHKRPHERSW